MIIALASRRQCVSSTPKGRLRYLTQARRFRRVDLGLAKSDRAISLLEELFPHEIQIGTPDSDGRQERNVPQIPVDTGRVASGSALVEQSKTVDSVNHRKRIYNNKDIAILVVQRASKHLTEEDFRRVVPSGRHIGGWTHQGEVSGVIKGRDRQTLEPEGTYFVMFSSPASAEAFKAHARQLHRQTQYCLSFTHSPPIPPASFVNTEARPGYSATEAYSIFSPSQQMEMRLVQQPFSPLMRQIIENQGYHILTKDKRSEYEVMVAVEGRKLSEFAFRRALGQDSRLRGTAWATIGPTSTAREVHFPFTPDRTLSNQQEIKYKTTEMEQKPKKTNTSKFIVSFKDKIEAKRFALAWQQKDISPLLDQFSFRDQPILARTEVIW